MCVLFLSLNTFIYICLWKLTMQIVVYFTLKRNNFTAIALSNKGETVSMTEMSDVFGWDLDVCDTNKTELK